MQQFIWPPTSSGSLPAGSATSANQVIEIGYLTTIASKTGPKSYKDSARRDYSGGSVTTGAWVQLIASTAGAGQGILLFDSSGQTMELGVGAVASETRVLIIQPGGMSGFIPLGIAAASRVSVRAISATASTGEIDLTILG